MYIPSLVLLTALFSEIFQDYQDRGRSPLPRTLGVGASKRLSSETLEIYFNVNPLLSEEN